MDRCCKFMSRYMKPSVFKSDVPTTSEIHSQLKDAFYFDCYKIRISDTKRSALSYFLEIVSKTPKWIDSLMFVRNKIVSMLGLIDLGSLSGIDPNKPASEYSVGDRVGIFSVLSINEQEAILGAFDKHLNVKLSICKILEDEGVSLSASTVVHIHNTLGKVYMVFFLTPVADRLCSRLRHMQLKRHNLLWCSTYPYVSGAVRTIA